MRSRTRNSTPNNPKDQPAGQRLATDQQVQHLGVEGLEGQAQPGRALEVHAFLAGHELAELRIQSIPAATASATMAKKTAFTRNPKAVRPSRSDSSRQASAIPCPVHWSHRHLRR